MNILICDDVDEDAQRLKTIIKELKQDSKIMVFTNPKEALFFINEQNVPDICFLDIIMPQINGVELAQKIREKNYKGQIVFLTTSNDFASESYKVKAASYLLKPPDKTDVENVLNEIENEQKTQDNKGVFIKTKTTSMFVMFKDISHIEVIGHKVYYRLLNGEEIIETARFSDVAPNFLADKRFSQCHRSFVVNMTDIYKIQSNVIKMKSGVNIPISRNYTDFSDKYVDYLFKERNK